VTRPGIHRAAPWIVYAVSIGLSVFCVAILAVTVVFDSQTERVTSGRITQDFSRRLDPDLALDYERVLGVAHNAGDETTTATTAAAYRVDAIEIDLRSAGGELVASHDAPLPFLEDVVFRGPSLTTSWKLAALRPTVLFHLKDRSASAVAGLAGFLAARPARHVIVQSSDPATLRAVARKLPRAERLLLVLDAGALTGLRRHPHEVPGLDGVSVRETLLTAGAQAWLERRRLRVFAWTVNDEARLNQLIRRGADGIITDRLDIMRLLGQDSRDAIRSAE
jgi:glycerophosphoryl diester phosphodiesterase